jgi:uncharacterized protein HemX
MEPEKKSHGALIGSIIIIVILIIGGLYVWQQKSKTIAPINTNPEVQNTTQNNSAELDTLDQEINGIDSTVDVNIDQVQ